MILPGGALHWGVGAVAAVSSTCLVTRRGKQHAAAVESSCPSISGSQSDYVFLPSIRVLPSCRASFYIRLCLSSSSMTVCLTISRSTQLTAAGVGNCELIFQCLCRIAVRRVDRRKQVVLSVGSLFLSNDFLVKTIQTDGWATVYISYCEYVESDPDLI